MAKPHDFRAIRAHEHGVQVRHRVVSKKTRSCAYLRARGHLARRGMGAQGRGTKYSQATRHAGRQQSEGRRWRHSHKRPQACAQASLQKTLNKASMLTSRYAAQPFRHRLTHSEYVVQTSERVDGNLSKHASRQAGNKRMGNRQTGNMWAGDGKASSMLAQNKQAGGRAVGAVAAIA